MHKSLFNSKGDVGHAGLRELQGQWNSTTGNKEVISSNYLRNRCLTVMLEDSINTAEAEMLSMPSNSQQ